MENSMPCVYNELITQSSIEQESVEQIVTTEKRNWSESGMDASLLRQKHVNYVLKCLDGLPNGFKGMDASRSWFCYWGLHSIYVMGYKPEKCLLKRVITFLGSCQSAEGGYAGGPGQLPHLATTYASVMTLIEIGTDEALSSINPETLMNFLFSMRQPNGSFTIHKGGETDVRAAYCALAVAHICGLSRLDELFDGTASWLMRCQTYEGGFGGEPNCEAHGGYTFCALAGLALLGKIHLVNIDLAIKWLVNRQLSVEGGFQGRTNKLVDGCYSYWQAACFSTIECNETLKEKDRWKLFDIAALQSYILEACQTPTGGLRDKPDKNPDPYHSCYILSGLSIAQLYAENKQQIMGGDQNIVEAVHPVYNITMDSYTRAVQYFASSRN